MTTTDETVEINVTGEPEIEVSISSHVVDNRKYKLYGRKLAIGFRFKEGLHEEVGRSFDQLINDGNGLGFKVKCVTQWCDPDRFRYDYETSLSRADKPSRIISEGDLLEQFGGKQCVMEKVQACLRKAIEHADAVVKAERDQEWANIAIAHYAKELREEAKKAVWYEQRLSALKADLEAEIEVMMKSKRVQIKKEMEEDDEKRFTDRSIALTLAHVKEEALRNEDLFYGRLRRNNQVVKVERPELLPKKLFAFPIDKHPTA